MGVIRRALGLEESVTVAAERVRVGALVNDLEVARESFVDAELALEDRGWQRLGHEAEVEFSRDGLRKAAALCRLVAQQDPLVKRGLAVRQAYVHGQGVQIQARAAGENGEQDVNAVVQAFLDEQGNQASLTGDQAREELERSLGTDGNVFFALFTSPLTGFVQVRSIPFDEIADIVRNPEDRDDPWFYRRQWNEQTITQDGRVVSTPRTAFYPADTYRPRVRLKTLDGEPVMWDAPVVHVFVNRTSGAKFGIGDAYAALPWARLYKDFLVDWAIVVKSLSQLSFRASTKNAGKAQGMRKALARLPQQGDPFSGNPNAVGGTFVGGEGDTIEAIPKSGATIDSESGRPLAAMIGAALDVPVTTLLADPGIVGSRAMGQTLNLPTRLGMQQRQGLWGQTYRRILAYVVMQAAKAPQGPLQGVFGRDPFTGRETLILANDTDPTIEVKWPSLKEDPIDVVMKAIVDADATGKMPPLETLKLMLHVLEVEDPDEILDLVTDDDGNWVDPFATVGQAVGDRAVAAFRGGADPAEAVR